MVLLNDIDSIGYYYYETPCLSVCCYSPRSSNTNNVWNVNGNNRNVNNNNANNTSNYGVRPELSQKLWTFGLVRSTES